MPKAKRRLYLAYGSNHNLRQMSNRCPTAKVAGTAVLRDWRLVFNGVASIERHKGGKVPVLVWDIKPKDEEALDAYEGWPRLYRKEPIRITLNSKQVRAMVYIMNGGQRGKPNSYYYNAIREGYKSAGFDLRILCDAAQDSVEEGEISMSPIVMEQILAVRDTGETNMFDTNAVTAIANREGFYELVVYLIDHKREYSQFILTGRTEGDV